MENMPNDVWDQKMMTMDDKNFNINLNIDFLWHSLKCEEVEVLSLALEFFIKFSRLEFAMKKCARESMEKEDDFVECRGKRFYFQYDRLNIDWDDFQDDDCVAYLRKYPPKKQVCKDGEGYSWEDAGKDTPIEYMKVIRNNLFHGGKHGALTFAGNGEDIDSSLKLLRAALTILKKCLEKK